MLPADMTLPIEKVIPQLQNQLLNNTSAVLVAAPGAGKTTRVPLALWQQPWLAGKRILMLEPRRIATRNAARYMAQQMGENVGDTVGYRMRLENKTSRLTRIEVVTEGLLTRLIQEDPELSDYGLIIFDEFHERNLHSDLGLALAHQCQQIFRPDLRLLVMSATLDDQALAEKLATGVIESDGRSFETETIYRPSSQMLQSNRHELAKHCHKVILEALQHPGDLLVFLPGAGEIETLRQRLVEDSQLSSTTLIAPLHGQLSDKEQKQALQPNERRKIILATNIAESSVTIDGVRIVIDSGFERRQKFEVRSGLSRLTTQLVSQASAAQRGGRAGRQAPGWCYRLWAESGHHTRPEHIDAEMNQTDLSGLLLELLQWGSEADELLWLTPPPQAALHQARALLDQLTISQAGQYALTDHGQQCCQTGLAPRWAHALLTAQTMGMAAEAATLIASLQVLSHKQRRTDDLEQLLRYARQQSVWKQQIVPLASGWLKRISNRSDHTPLNPALIVALAYPDRIARLRQKGGSQYQLANGAGAQLSDNSALQQHEWLAVCDMSGPLSHPGRESSNNIIRLGVPLTDQDLEQLSQYHSDLISEQVVVDWQSNGQLLAEKQLRFGQIIWKKQKLPQLSDQQWQQAWKNYFQQHGLASLPWEDNSKDLCLRAELLRSNGHHPVPAMDDDSLMSTLGSWLLPYLNNARHLRDLKKVDLYNALLARLDWETQQQLNDLVPTHWVVASGSRIRLDYSQNPPVLAVKLQEMFGFQGQPAIINHTQPLMIHLLSPAKRPLAVTQDLPSFWQNAYPEVCKDMRGRYPKHPWPDDPMQAQATAFTKKKQSQITK